MRSPGELQLRQAVDTNRSEGKDDRWAEGAMTDGGLFLPVSVIVVDALCVWKSRVKVAILLAPI